MIQYLRDLSRRNAAVAVACLITIGSIVIGGYVGLVVGINHLSRIVGH